MLNDSEIQRALVIAAHPDDIDFTAAGTIALWTDAGIEVIYCLVTDGDAGGFDEGLPRSEMAPMRRKEQTAAAAVVGVHDLRFLGYPDGRVEPTLGLRKDLARVIRQVRPDRLVCPSPERNYVRVAGNHPDHRAVGSAALDAVYPDARNPFAWPELLADEALEPWTVREVWISAAPSADHYRGHHGRVPPQGRGAAGSREPDRASGRPGGVPPRLADPHRPAGRTPRGTPGRDVPGPRHRVTVTERY